MASTRRILIGLGAGVTAGIFLGDRAGHFDVVAEAFVKLLQMTVLPYVTLSIVTSLGSLDYAQARTLGLRAGAVLVGLWGVALTFPVLCHLSVPSLATARCFSPTLVERRPPFDFVSLYIPSNPFNSLANNVVPAVVLFSVLVGVALIRVPRKQILLDVLRVASDAVSHATRLTVTLTPIGLFAIAAAAAGTLDVEQLGRLQVYLAAYVSIGLLVSLWVLPGLIAALTPVRMGEIFRLTRDALVTATVAGDLFIVLPVLTEASRTLLERHGAVRAGAASLPEVIVPASFNFPHTGKLLSISFVLFAGWFADAAVGVREYPWLALTGLLTFFGSLNAAVPFLLDLFRIPADTFQLFLATGVINARVGTLVAAMHTLAVALIGASAISGTLRFERAALLRYTVVTAALTLAVVGTTRAVFAGILRPEYTRDKVLAGMHLLHEPAVAVVHRAAPPLAAVDGRPILDHVQALGVLRVGYVSDALPFAFFNQRGTFVGFDVELAHRLASELGVRLEFLPLRRVDLEQQLAAGYCDLVMSGIPLTTRRASKILFSQPYLDETFALVVPDHDREAFSSWARIRARTVTTIAVPDLPYYVEKLRERVPNARLHAVPDVASVFAPDAPAVDAILMPAERGSAWTLLHPKYAVVVPEPGIIKVPLAYPVRGRDEAFVSFLNSWIDLKRKDGTLDRLYAYWVLGRDAAPPAPRWSIIRDVLHWVE